MKPTLHLRWHEVYKNEQLEDACGVSPIYYPEDGKTYFVLQQWWEDDNNNGEWKNIETDYSFDMKTSPCV